MQARVEAQSWVKPAAVGLAKVLQVKFRSVVRQYLRGQKINFGYPVTLAAPVVRVVRNRVDGPSLNGALARTGMLQLVFCVLLSAGLLLS